jgi:hypothetical protein
MARKHERAVAMVEFLQPTMETSPARQHDPFFQNNPKKRALFVSLFLPSIDPNPNPTMARTKQTYVPSISMNLTIAFLVLTKNQFAAPAKVPEAKRLANSSPPRRRASPPRPRVVSRSRIVTVRVQSPCARFVGTKSRPTC